MDEEASIFFLDKF